MTDSEAYDNVEDVARDRQDEQIREQRWSEFVAWCRSTFRLHAFDIVIHRAADCIGNHGPITGSVSSRLIDFAETEGWDGVLTAIARAYREEQKEKKS